MNNKASLTFDGTVFKLKKKLFFSFSKEISVVQTTNALITLMSRSKKLLENLFLFSYLNILCKQTSILFETVQSN